MDCCGTDINKIDRSGWTKGCKERINKLRDAYFAHEPEIDVERAVAYTKTYKETEGEAMIVRRAKAYYNYMATKTIDIPDGELLAGTFGKKGRSAIVNPDMSWKWLEDELDTIATRTQDPYQIREEDKKILREEIFPYWQGKSAQDMFYANIGSLDAKLLTETDIISVVHSETGVGECVPDIGGILFEKGFGGIQKEADQALADMDPYDGERYAKSKFYEAVIISCQTAKTMADRYAEKAYELAEKEANPVRKEELKAIGDRCHWVPCNPPRNFAEAVQFVEFVEVLIWTEEGGTAICIDRPDQYLYPFYKQDVEAGILTDLQALELIECLWIKMAEVNYFISDASAKYYAGYQTFNGLTLSGTDKDGNDATNELSVLMLHATRDLQMHSPTTNVRISENCPQEFLSEVLDLIKVGTGQPAIYFDSTAIALLKRHGCSEEDARSWCVGGCIEPHVPGKMHRWNEGGRYCYANAVEWALFDGFSIVHNEYYGLRTGDPSEFKTFEEFKNAVVKQLAFTIRKTTDLILVSENIHREFIQKPMQSTMTRSCLASGKDTMSGGAIYNLGPGMETTGIADLADAVIAVKKYVYDEKRFTMADLVEMLRTNFEGKEDLRLMLLNEAPKYGNDVDEVDMLLKEFLEFSAEEATRHKNTLGVPFSTGAVPVTANVPHGKSVWALPSGRKATDALADGASPENGCDTNGPTAVIKSVCKPDHTACNCGTLLNVKLAPELLASQADRKNFNSLLAAEKELGGYHVQFNVTNNETLLKAQETPEQYTNLLVRVAGYSAFFVDLHKDTQDAIIGRTENTRW